MGLFDIVEVKALQNLALNSFAKFSYKFVVKINLQSVFTGCVS